MSANTHEVPQRKLSNSVPRMGRLVGRMTIYRADLKRLWRYGPNAPRYSERIWINPNGVRANPFAREVFSIADSGRVVHGSWPRVDARPEDVDVRFRECLQHWEEGLTWEETGRVDRWMGLIASEGQVHGCRSLHEVMVVLGRWDAIFEQVARDGRIRTQREVKGGVFRERGGIGINIGPSGQAYKGRDGHHRFAMARALRLPVIPARIGVVHESAIPELRRLRTQPTLGGGSL